MTIRLATPADAALLQALAHSIWNRVYPEIISQDQISYMLERMYNPARIEMEINSGYVWEIVEVDNAPAGFLCTIVEPNHALKISKIYLEPAHHGKGLGQLMLKHIDEHAKNSGVKEVYLFVNRGNTRALRSYLRAGYAVVETLDQEYGPFVLNDYRLEKSV